MDASFNYENEYAYDEVRIPDKVINERLIEFNKNDYDTELNEVLYLSMEEFNNQEKINEIYEKEIINKGKFSLMKISESYFQNFKKRWDTEEPLRNEVLEHNKLEIRNKKIDDIFDEID